MFKIIFNKMDSFELNKIIAAVLMVALLVIGIGKLSDVIFHVEKPKTPGYAVDIGQVVTASAASSETLEEKIDIAALMAIGVFLAVTVIGFVKNGVGFFSLFWISSAPLALRPALALIEIISYFVRPVSHSIRLAGNMMAGHAVIKVFAAFAGVALISPLSVVAITAMYALETLVSFIQAYVFAILTCVYLKDALHPHH